MRPRIVRLQRHHPVCLGERIGGDIGIARRPFVGDVVGFVLLVCPDDWGIGLEALHRAGDYRQRVIVDHNGVGAILGDVWIGGDDRSYLLALEADLVCRQHGLGVPGHCRHPSQVVLGQELTGYDGEDAVDGLGGRRVDAVDRGVRPRTADKSHVQHPRQHDVVDVVAGTLDEAVVFVSLDTVTDASDLRRCLR